MGEHEKLYGVYEIEIRQSRIERLKDKISGFVYMIKSYLKLVPCGYCGKANDPEMMCYKCWKKIRRGRGARLNEKREVLHNV